MFMLYQEEGGNMFELGKARYYIYIYIAFGAGCDNDDRMS